MIEEGGSGRVSEEHNYYAIISFIHLITKHYVMKIFNIFHRLIFFTASMATKRIENKTR